MSILDYQKFSAEIRLQPDTLMAVDRYNKLCQVFIQDSWLETKDPELLETFQQKTDIMFELQGHFIK